MQFHLVVISPFGGHEAGAVISDPVLIEQFLQTHGERVVKIAAPAASSTSGKEG